MQLCISRSYGNQGTEDQRIDPVKQAMKLFKSKMNSDLGNDMWDWLDMLKVESKIKRYLQAMKLDPEQLSQNDFVLLDTLGHMEIVPFVSLYLKKRTRSSIFFNMSNLALLVCVGWYFGKHVGSGAFSLDAGFTHLSYGLALAFALIPLHEYIHVLAYKSQGATKTSYDANLKRFYFMAVADKFVANRKEFQIVALAPFTVISITLLLLIFLAGKLWTLTIMAMLLAHTACCSGDFGLLSYFDFHQDKQVLTYDDKEKGISYFYAKTIVNS